jgi:hypothetical protein
MPLVVLAAAFVPALIALVIIAAQTTVSPPIAERASIGSDDVRSRQAGLDLR